MRRSYLLIVIATLTVMGACEEAIGPDANEAGRYELVSVNGRSLPTAFFSVEVLSASVELNADKTYSTQSTVRGKDSLGQPVTQSHGESGVYTRTDNTLRLTSTSGDLTIATYGGRTIIMGTDTVAMVYRR